LLAPAAGSAAAERSPNSGMAPIARKEIRIALSVRKTMSIRTAEAVPGGGPQQQSRYFCVWSNSPNSQYNVTAELQPDHKISVPPVLVQSGNLGCLTQGPVITLLNKIESSPTNANSPNVVTLLISVD
jgi:hypothetical protein